MSNNHKNGVIEKMVERQIKEECATKGNKNSNHRNDKSDSPSSTDKGDAFGKVCAKALFPETVLPSVTFSDGKNDKGIDFYRIDEDGSIVIAQCKYDDDTTLKRISGEAENTRDFIRHLCAGGADNNDSRFDAISELCAGEEESAVLGRINYYFFMASSAKGDCSVKEQRIKESTGFGNVYIYDGERIVALNQERLKTTEGVPDLDFGITPDEMESAKKAYARKLEIINAHAKTITDKKHEEYVPVEMFSVILLGTDIANAVDKEYKNRYELSRLLCSNVRAYLDNKNLRESMKETILHEAQNFAPCNNGITVICLRAEPKQNANEDNKASVSLKSGVVVNGGQTIANIYNDFKNGLDVSGVGVQCTVIIAQSKEYRKKISICRNTQKVVDASDIRSVDDDAVLLQEHLRYENYCLGLKKGKDGSKKVKGIGKFENIRKSNDIKHLAQIYAAFAVHQPYIGRNCGKDLLLEEPWWNNFAHNDYTHDNSAAAAIASIGALDSCLTKVIQKYKSNNPGAETEGLGYLALYVLGIQAGVIYKAGMAKKTSFKDFKYDIPEPLTLADFNEKYGKLDLETELRKISLPKYEMMINHMSETEIMSLLTNPKYNFVDWLYKDVVKQSDLWKTSIIEGIKRDFRVQWRVADDFCVELATYNYETCAMDFPCLELLKPREDE